VTRDHIMSACRKACSDQEKRMPVPFTDMEKMLWQICWLACCDWMEAEQLRKDRCRLRLVTTDHP
jgi:hypothetical protein